MIGRVPRRPFFFFRRRTGFFPAFRLTGYEVRVVQAFQAGHDGGL
jgi:hypothetical protein